MRITTILGSPRRHGNTAAVLEQFETLAAGNATVRRINICDLQISGCRGCDACQSRAGGPNCIQKDDLNQVLITVIASDLVVYAAPVYVWDFPAQMKMLMDRHYCLTKTRVAGGTSYLLEGKRVALLSTCGGPSEDNADLLRLIFRREMAFLHCRVEGEYVVGGCTTPSDLGDRARELGCQMAHALLKT